MPDPTAASRDLVGADWRRHQRQHPIVTRAARTVLTRYGLAAGVVGVVLAGCSSRGPVQSPHAQSLPSASPAATASGSASSSSLPTAPASPAASAQPAEASAAASPPSPCAASTVLIKVTSATYNADGSLDLTGHQTTPVGCGGPEDSFGYRTSTATETVHAAPQAKIAVIPLPMGNPAVKTLSAASFPRYVASDQDTRIFAVRGPLTDVTTLCEMYHP